MKTIQSKETWQWEQDMSLKTFQFFNIYQNNPNQNWSQVGKYVDEELSTIWRTELFVESSREITACLFFIPSPF